MPWLPRPVEADPTTIDPLPPAPSAPTVAPRLRSMVVDGDRTILVLDRVGDAIPRTAGGTWREATSGAPPMLIFRDAVDLGDELPEYTFTGEVTEPADLRESEVNLLSTAATVLREYGKASTAARLDTIASAIESGVLEPTHGVRGGSDDAP